ncbi:hypothetical protein [Lysinibacillus fusiformis]|uniref:hypothetical protein n=1 Tax=Lysinibacillus fusiformis TaxID=28031 RepID=UPI0004697EFC|nr:hypothetical protein [Lysinibacillus fusiformis]
MYREFGIVGIFTNLVERTIKVEFTLDIDPDSASLDSLVLCDKETSRIILADIKVSKKVITMYLQEWPEAEKQYLLRIQSGIRSIVEDVLSESLLKEIVFKSEVLSTVNVLSPSNHEVLNELHFMWEEISVDGKNENLVSSYFLQIAKENTFYNVVHETEVVGKQEIRITDIDEGQYYLRVRAQKNGTYGRWSKVISFLVRQAKDKTASYEEQLRIILAPVNGETPSSFVFQFDEDIDTDIMPSIVVKRRLI